MPLSANVALADAHNLESLESLTAVLTRPGHFELQSHILPLCKADEVTLRLEGCGVCASSLPLWQGREWFQYPLAPGAPGHEGWGEIVALGRRAAMINPTLELGKKVTCLGGAAFAQFMNVAAADVVLLPDTWPPQPFPGEAVGCAMNIFRRAEIQSAHTVAIIGAGFLGLLLVQLAVASGARVLVMSRRAFARDQAQALGAAATFDTEDWWSNALRMVELTEGHGVDRVIEATGLQFALDVATELLADYGKLIIAGYHQDGLREVNMQRWNWKGIDVINAHERDSRRAVEGMEQAIANTLADTLNPARLLTHRFPLAQLNQAFERLEQRPDGFIKGWIEL